MVVNDVYKFIFVHVPKTGGTSVARALKELEGNNRRVVNHLTKHEILRDFFRAAPQRLGFLGKRKTLEYQSYFKFGFVRNPWDRMASLYCYLKEKRPHPQIDEIHSFAHFLDQLTTRTGWIASLHSVRSQFEFFTNEAAEIEADFIGSFEKLRDEFEFVQRKIGINLQLTRRNESSNSRGNYRNLYTPELREIVGARFAKEIAFFGFQF